MSATQTKIAAFIERMTIKNNFPFYFEILTSLIFGIFGFIVNYFKVELFFNVDFIFGSLIVMLVILRKGIISGIVTGFVTSICTMILWKHPWAIIIMTLEASCVAFFYHKISKNLIICDILYWLFIGAPLIYFFYHHVMDIQLQSTTLIMLKQPVNGICNSLLANIINQIIQVIHTKRDKQVSLRELLFVIMVSFVVFPVMFLLIFELKKNQKEQMVFIASKVSNICELATENLSLWINDNHHNVKTLSRLIGNPDTTPINRIQNLVEVIKAAAPGFIRMGVMDQKGISIAFSPSHDDKGASYIGLDFSDRPYVPMLKKNMQPYVADIVISKLNQVIPILPLLAPMIHENQYKGFCGGVVDLSKLKGLISILSNENRVDITVLDRYQRIITSTRKDLKVMDNFRRLPGTTEQFKDTDVYHWVPFTKHGTSVMQRWRESLMIREKVVSFDYQWKIIVECSLLPVINSLTILSIRTLILLIFLILIASLVSFVASQKLTFSLNKLREITEELPLHLSNISTISMSLPDSKIIEVRQLMDNFCKMSEALAASFRDQKLLNENLELRVIERTDALNLANQRLNEALMISKEMFSKAFQLNPNGISITTMKDGRFINVNAGFLRVTGYALEEVIGKTIHELNLISSRDEQISMMERIKNGCLNQFEFKSVTKSGKRWDGIISAEVISLGDENCLLANIEDVTNFRRLEREVMEIGDRERNRIGQDLHDDLCPHLIGIEGIAKVLQNKLKGISSDLMTHRLSETISELIKSAVEKSRRLAQGLSPVHLVANGLESALNELAKTVKEIYSISCEVDFQKGLEFTDNIRATHFFYISQEAVNNAIKHGKADRVQISLKLDHHDVRMTITDNGLGFSATNKGKGGKGMGMNIMRYRAKMIGASIDITSMDKGGTQVRVLAFQE